jgi:protein required for attachment to host cells
MTATVAPLPNIIFFVLPFIRFRLMEARLPYAAGQRTTNTGIVVCASTSANPDRSRLDEDDFAAGVANHLNRLALGGEIASLFVIADPRTLGELRRHFHEVTMEKLIGDLARDLTGSSVEAIEAAFARV